jgi:uncharacterized Fe-S cluster-containing protein
MWGCPHSKFKKIIHEEKGLIDYTLALAYIVRKNELEQEAMERAKNKRS